MNLSTAQKKDLIDWQDPELSINKQCELLSLSKGALYYTPVPMSSYDLELMDFIDRQYLKTPFYGSRKITICLQRYGYTVNRKKVQRLMGLMGLQGITPGPNLSKRRQQHKIYPYLLRGLSIVRPNQVWATDITYIRINSGFMYLMAVMDLYSRFVLSWRLSNSLDTSFCVDALEAALQFGIPDIFNVDQGSQFTSEDFLKPLKDNNVNISMDSKGRAFDNIFVERLWRTVKYEEIYLHDYQNAIMARNSIKKYFCFYNYERPHQSLRYYCPAYMHPLN